MFWNIQGLYLEYKVIVEPAKHEIKAEHEGHYILLTVSLMTP